MLLMMPFYALDIVSNVHWIAEGIYALCNKSIACVCITGKCIDGESAEEDDEGLGPVWCHNNDKD